MSKIVTFNPEALTKLVAGVNTLANAVGATLGPKGRNVLIDTPHGVPTTTKDGVTVAKFIDLKDPIEDLGAQVVKQAAKKCSDVAGDGTTTTTVIAQSLINESLKLISAGIPPIDIKRDFELYLNETLQFISTHSTPVDDAKLKDIATISANNDEAIGSLIASAFQEVTTEGIIIVEDSRSNETYTKVVDGISFDRGYLSGYFATDTKKMEVIYENPLILISDKKIRSHTEITKALEFAVKTKRPLLIIADEIEGQAINLMVVNKMRMGIDSCAVKAPAFGMRRLEILQDLAILTGATLVSESSALSLENIELSMLGSAKKVIVTSESTTIVSPLGDVTEIANRAEQIKNELLVTTSDYDKQKLTERLAKLIAKVAVLYVGAATETELKEKKYRIDDALRATRAAIEKGYVVGGGTLLLHASTELQADSLTGRVFKSALLSPIRKILINAGESPDIIINDIKGYSGGNERGQLALPQPDINFGFNAKTLEYGDLIQMGVIDPTLVVEQSLINAVSVANQILMSDVTIYDTQPKYTPPDPNDFG